MGATSAGALWSAEKTDFSGLGWPVWRVSYEVKTGQLGFASLAPAPVRRKPDYVSNLV